MNRARLLVLVYDHSYLLFLADRAFGKGGHDIVAAFTVEDALARLKRESFDVLIAEEGRIKAQGMAALWRAKEQSPKTIVLLLSGRWGSFVVVEMPQDLRDHRARTLEEVVGEFSLRPRQ